MPKKKKKKSKVKKKSSKKVKKKSKVKYFLFSLISKVYKSKKQQNQLKS